MSKLTENGKWLLLDDCRIIWKAVKDMWSNFKMVIEDNPLLGVSLVCFVCLVILTFVCKWLKLL